MSRVQLYSFLMVFGVFISSISQIVLKKAAGKTYKNHIREYLNASVIIAYGLFFTSTIFNILALKYVMISYVPIIESTGYIFVTALGAIFLHEKIGKKKIIGLFIIISGVLIFSL
jgi:small multidrug resistance pump